MGRKTRHRACTASRQPIAEVAAAIAAAITLLVTAGTAAAAAPPPCNGQAQITDAAHDGHHAGTDVLSAWFSESSGHLQVVVKVQAGNWFPDHTPGVAGFAFLFGVGGQIRYVRAEGPDPPPVRFDYGTWTLAGGFVSAGQTTGSVIGGPGGTATIDVPVQTGAVAGAVLTNPFVLTSDGDGPIDRAPGGTLPDGAEYGADYVVGSCVGSGGNPGGGGSAGVSSVELRAPKKRVGRGRARVRGSIAPARAGMSVELTIEDRRKITRRLTTGADGTFSALVPIGETTRLRAVAGGLRSQTLTITMISKTRISVRRLRNGGVLVKGRVNPTLPGRVLLLRTNAVKPSATTTTRKGRFSFRFKHLRRGRYQAVFIPSKRRAERSTSNKGVIR